MTAGSSTDLFETDERRGVRPQTFAEEQRDVLTRPASGNDGRICI